MEAAAEVGGVGEGLELTQGRGLRIALLIEQPFSGGYGEPGALMVESGGMPAERLGGFGDGGEIDVGGDVGLAGVGQRVFASSVFGKGAEGAGAAVGVIIIRPGESVVRP